jgi:adenylosuccinate synthase
MIKAVIGGLFGDEGKGLVVDYLCSKSSNPLVIRFSGGHQVSHTVVNGDIRHVFSNFGSGTLRNIPTYWSKYCTIEPIGLMKELSILKSLGIEPKLYIDENCPITTPYDIYYNKWLSDDCKNGTCGVGYGRTLQREELHYSLLFRDLFYPKIFKEKLRLISKLYKFEEITSFSAQVDNFIEACSNLITNSNIEVVDDSFDLNGSDYDDIIFEGSQGLLLDQNFGFFPNVTRSNTGMKNIYEICKPNIIDIYIVIRAYQTRHGNGFMTNENIPNNIYVNPLETNKDNQWQGKFRIGLLDLSLLEYALNKDSYIKRSWNKNLVITCLDHIKNEYRFTYKDEIINCFDENEFIGKISSILKIKNIYLSRNADSKYLECFN